MAEITNLPTHLQWAVLHVMDDGTERTGPELRQMLDDEFDVPPNDQRFSDLIAALVRRKFVRRLKRRGVNAPHRYKVTATGQRLHAASIQMYQDAG